MTKQLLIYGSVKPVSTSTHRNWSVKTGEDYKFSKSINSIPVMAAEFPKAAADNAIVFTGDDKLIMPVLIMGIREGENLFVNNQGKWLGRYVPAFLRRYPFVFSSSDQGKTFTLCIDEEFEGCNQDGSGERLFDDAGEQTGYLNKVLEFLKEYQVHYRRTENFSKKLLELDILEPMTAQFKTLDGTTANLTGFQAVNREKLKKLTGEQMVALANTDELELIYIHMQSLQNLTQMLEKFQGKEQQEIGEEVRQNTTRVRTKKTTSKKAGTSSKSTKVSGTAAKPAKKKKIVKK